MQKKKMRHPGHRRLAAAYSSILALVLVTAACSGESSTDDSDSRLAGPDQTIVVAASAEPTTFDLQQNLGIGSRIVLGQVFEALYTFDPDGQVAPLLAADLPVEVDPTHFDVTLREDVTFSDGTPFNADAVVYSINRAIDPNTASTIANFKAFKAVTKTGDYSVRITTASPAPLLGNFLTELMIFPPRPAGTDLNTVSAVIGTGPYLLTQYQTGQGATLEYNKNYRGDKPQITRVEIQFIPDAGTRVQALRAGQVDLAPDLTPTDAESISKVLNVASTSQPGFTAQVRINTLAGVTKDLRVRQAMNYAIDRQAIVDTLFDGGKYAKVSHCTPLPFGTGGTSDAVEMLYSYDPEKAQDLVREAGAEGEQVELVAPSGAFPEDRSVSELIANSLTKIGLDVKLTFEPSYTQYIKQLTTRAEAAAPLVFTGTGDTIHNVTRALGYFYSSAGATSSYQSQEMDDLIAKVSVDNDQATYDQILNLGCHDAPFIFLYDYSSIYGMSKKLTWNPGADTFGNWLKYTQMSVVQP